jgi:hypothetical protein
MEMLETDKEESWVKARETQTPEHEGPEVGGGVGGWGGVLWECGVEQMQEGDMKQASDKQSYTRWREATSTRKEWEENWKCEQ